MAMDVVMNYLQRIENLVLTLRFWDVLDILVIALLIYKLLMFVQKTNVSRVIKGVLVFIIRVLATRYHWNLPRVDL